MSRCPCYRCARLRWRQRESLRERRRSRRWPLTPRGVTIVLALTWAAMVAVIVGEYTWQSHKQNGRHRPGTASASGAYTDGGGRR